LKGGSLRGGGHTIPFLVKNKDEGKKGGLDKIFGETDSVEKILE